MERRSTHANKSPVKNFDSNKGHLQIPMQTKVILKDHANKGHLKYSAHKLTLGLLVDNKLCLHTHTSVKCSNTKDWISSASTCSMG